MRVGDILKGETLIKIREELNLTQEDVAAQSKITRSYYTMIETGKRTPSVNVAKRIASTLNFDWTLFFYPDSNDSLHRKVMN